MGDSRVRQTKKMSELGQASDERKHTLRRARGSYGLGVPLLKIPGRSPHPQGLRRWLRVEKGKQTLSYDETARGPHPV